MASLLPLSCVGWAKAERQPTDFTRLKLAGTVGRRCAVAHPTSVFYSASSQSLFFDSRQGAA